MPKQATIQINVVQATDIEQFRQPSGRRTYGMLYFQEMDSVMVADCIHEHTDIQLLIKNLEHGKIYILQK